ncbi:MAG: hypothetical protein PVI99_10310 [Anaerolineales bacterium]|jgi:hypothetical protein
MDLGQYIIIGLSIFFALWYFVGAIINRKRGVATFHWLRDGLETNGKVTEARWIGSSGSGARLTVGVAQPPFQRIEVVFLLDSREILPLWLVNLLRNKRDEMILKANLRSRPSVELEIGRQGSKDVKVLKAGGDMPPYQQAGTAAGFDILSRGKANETQLARLQSFIEKYNTSIKRISLQRQMPHLILRTDLPPLREKEAEAFFRDLNEWLMI